MFLLKFNLEIEFRIAIMLNALKRYFRRAVDFAQSILV